jgi:uncharacterized protein
MPAPVTHFEITVKDSRKGKRFYESLFGWKVTTLPGLQYGLVDTGVRMGINGGIGQVPPGDRPRVVFFVQVEDLAGTLTRAIGQGGQVVVPVTEVPGMVSFALFSDPDGNVVGLVEGPESPPRRARSGSRPGATGSSGKPKSAKRKRT